MNKLAILIGFVLWMKASLYTQPYPPFQVTVFDSADTGYYFLCPIRVGPNPGGIGSTHIILDKTGHVIYFRKFPPDVNSGDFKLHPNGLMSFSVQGRFFFMDSTFTVVDSAFCQNGVFQDGHDVQLFSNGHFLLLGFENIPMNLSAYPWFGNNGSPGSANALVRSGVVQELDSAKNVVFEWHAADHYDFADVDERYLNNPFNVDWTHFNAVEADDDGNILVSVRHFNEITKINRADGSVMWRLGGKKNQFAFFNDPAQFVAQHDGRRIENGNLTLFDNGRNGQPLHPASAKEYRLDEQALTATLEWKYTESPNAFSRALGNAQRLADGNTLINYGLLTNANLVFNVVDPAGNKVFEISFDDSLTSYRSFHYPAIPWQLNRPEITCLKVGSTFFLDAGGGHDSYLWSNGETSQTIQVNDPGTYFVYVPRGKGFVSSEIFIVEDVFNPCNPVSTPEPEVQPYQLHPNPASDRVTLRLPGTAATETTIEMTDIMGRKLIPEIISGSENEITFDISHVAPGIYIIFSGGYAFRLIKP